MSIHSFPTADLRPLQQHPRFCAALAAVNTHVLTLQDSENSQILLCNTPLLGPISLLNRTRLSAPLQTRDAIIDAGLGRGPVLINPDGPRPYLSESGACSLVGAATVAELNLDRPTDILRQSLRQKWRNRLRHAEKSNLQVSQAPFDATHHHWLIAAETHAQKTRGYRNWPHTVTQAFANAHPDHAVVFTAHQGAHPVAAMLFLYHGAVCTYHLAQTTPKGRHVSAHNLLMWKAILHFSAIGALRMDLGLINTEDAPDLARFKLGTGARPRPLGGTWLWFPDRPWVSSFLTSTPFKWAQKLDRKLFLL